MWPEARWDLEFFWCSFCKHKFVDHIPDGCLGRKWNTDKEYSGCGCMNDDLDQFDEHFWGNRYRRTKRHSAYCFNGLTCLEDGKRNWPQLGKKYEVNADFYLITEFGVKAGTYFHRWYI